MATTLTVNALRQTIGWTLEDAQTFGNSSNSNSFSYSKTLANGTGAGSANKIYVVQDDTGIASSSAVTLDLQSLTSMFDDAVSFSKIRAIYLENASTSSGADLLVGAAAATQWASATAFISDTEATMLIPSGGSMMVICTNVDGWAVGATTKSLKLANASTTAALPYKLVIVGE